MPGTSLTKGRLWRESFPGWTWPSCSAHLCFACSSCPSGGHLQGFADKTPADGCSTCPQLMFQGESCWESKGKQLRGLLRTLQVFPGWLEYFFVLWKHKDSLQDVFWVHTWWLHFHQKHRLFPEAHKLLENPRGCCRNKQPRFKQSIWNNSNDYITKMGISVAWGLFWVQLAWHHPAPHSQGKSR